MQKYELAIVLDGKVSAAKKKAVLATIQKVIDLLKGKVGTIQDWGVKELAYKIKKSTTGAFVLLPLELTSDSVKKLIEKVKTEGDIIRYLLVKI